MMDEISLENASVSDGEDVLEMLHEIGPGAYGFSNDAYALTFEEFKAWIQKQIESARGMNIDKVMVPQTTYWLRRDGYPIGLSRLRHSLNQALRIRGGNIGFCIRPTERGKGLAPMLLEKTIIVARKMGIDRVLLTCDTANAGSWKTIEKCGGLLESIEDGWRRYWIVT